MGNTNRNSIINRTGNFFAVMFFWFAVAFIVRIAIEAGPLWIIAGSLALICAKLFSKGN